MKKVLFIITMCILTTMGAWAATFGNGTVEVSGTTATFTGLKAGDVAAATDLSAVSGATSFVFVSCELNGDDAQKIVSNSWMYVDLYNAAVTSDQDVTVYLCCYLTGVVMPRGTTLTEENIETYSSYITDGSNNYVVKISADGTECYILSASSTAMGMAMAAASPHVTEVTKLTTNSNNTTMSVSTLASAISGKGSNIKTMVCKNVWLNGGDLNFDNDNVESLTLNNVKLEQGNFTLDGCENLKNVTFGPGCLMQNITITNNPKLDNVDLKYCAIGTKWTNSGNNTASWVMQNYTVNITNNALLRYIIIPHNFNGTKNLTEGNYNLYTVIATAWLSKKVYDENGNVLKNKNYGDSTVFVLKDGKNVITANYSMYKGNIPDDMMAIAQSVPYDHCMLRCMPPLADTVPTKNVMGIEHGVALLSESDMVGLNGFQAKTLDISRTFFYNPATVHAYNPYINYLILTDNMDFMLSKSVELDNTQYKTFESRVEQAPNLIAAVGYCGDPDVGNGNSDDKNTIKGAMVYAKEPGHVHEILNVSYHDWADVVTEESFIEPDSLHNLVLIGKFNAADLGGGLNGQASTKINLNGNWVGDGLSSDQQCPADKQGLWHTEQYTKKGLAQITRLDLTRAVFPVQNDMRIGQLVSQKLSKLYLPISAEMDRIPDSCLIFIQTMQDLCIPGNYKHIGNFATYAYDGGMPSFNHIFTTTIDQDGNGYPHRPQDTKFDTTQLVDKWPYAHLYRDSSPSTDFLKSNGGAITISENVEDIGTHAFWTIYVKDVFAMGKKAPKCAFNAFHGVSYHGNNTPADATDKLTREDFNVSTGWLALLNFPHDCDDTNRKHYTDIDRVYTIPDANNRTDGDGNIIRWPSHLDFSRSYNQAVLGITWNYWKDGSDGDNFKGSYTNPNVNGYNGGSYILVGRDGLPSTWNATTQLSSVTSSFSTWVKNTSSTYLAEFGADEPNIQDDYVGWHQFALAYPRNYLTDDPQWNVGKITDNDWYTLCLPFDLTKSQLLAAFGDPVQNIYPQLHALYGVTRDEDNEQIVLQFTKDLVASNMRWRFEDDSQYSTASKEHYEDATEDDPVILKSGYPYLLKPQLPQTLLDSISDGSMSKRTISYKYATEGNYDYATVPYLNYYVTATDGNDEVCTNGSDANYLYHFVGNYENDTVPQYAYYMGRSKSSGIHKFFRKTGTKSKIWSGSSAIIGANWDTPEGIRQYEFKSGSYINTGYVSWNANPGNDDLTKWSTQRTAPRYTMAFDDGTHQMTTITDVTTDHRGPITDVTYINLTGQKSATPFTGVNIVVTTYQDGTTTTTKAIQ